MFQSFYTAGPNGFWIFLVVTVIMCGGAAYVTGKAIAETWRPFWQVVVYALLLTCACRFLHYALFHEVMVSLNNYIVDFIVIMSNAASGYTLARKKQMALQYGWPRDQK
jgi:hypothetical protein